MSTPYGAARAPYPFRRHQQEALDALAAARADDRRRTWVVLPPGAGKTLVGLETIRREGVPALVLSPNTAIQGQWLRGWRQMDPDATITVDTDRDLAATVTSLTYQALAVFEDEDAEAVVPGEGTQSELARLHPNGRALVETLRDRGPVTVVLDECHHLIETWGRLLAEVLDLLPEAIVLGLTATPPASLSADQGALVGELFGEIVYAASIPAVVREGHLAPFADLIWLTEPTAHERQWLDEQNLRFRELTTALLDPAFGSVSFLSWVDRRFAGDLPMDVLRATEPELVDAALRLSHAALLHVPPDVVLGEQHRREPTGDDWARLVGDWYVGVLRDSVDDRDVDVVASLRRVLPTVGWQLTKHGLRRGRSPVDRVLARSEAKAGALVEIVTAEHRVLGDRLAMLVICDHEVASATLPADLEGVVPLRAGSARQALAHLVADPITGPLWPLMVTGRTVAAAPDVLNRLRATCPDLELVVGEPDTDGIAELAGSWSSRQWVPIVTEFFTQRRCQVLVGTRALLGEGWDAPATTGLVDLSTTTTPGSIVQTRGRALRLDPEDPTKVAINWTVCAVSAAHPRGDNDWQRTVRKHDGYFGVDDTGDVVDGVAHVHPSFSPYSAPPVSSFAATNAHMLMRAEARTTIRDAWAVGSPYVDQARRTIWIRARRDAASPAAVSTLSVGVLVTPPAVVLGADGVRGRAGLWSGLPAAGLGLAVLGGAAAAFAAPPLALLGPVVALAAWIGTASRRRQVVHTLSRAPDVVRLGCAVADALHVAGITRAGAAAVTWTMTPEGQVRLSLDNAADSAVFAEAVSELIAPVADPRYLVPRYVAPPSSRRSGLIPLASLRPMDTVWHAVPSVLGVRAELAQMFATHWGRWTGGGAAVYSGSPEGAGVLAAVRGLAPMETEAVLRVGWR
ncbi:MAG: DEAD/DEAH box helicase family protein [Nocardioides sp.]